MDFDTVLIDAEISEDLWDTSGGLYQDTSNPYGEA